MVYQRLKPDSLLPSSSSSPLATYDSIGSSAAVTEANNKDEEHSPLFFDGGGSNDHTVFNNQEDFLNYDMQEADDAMLPSRRRRRTVKKTVIILFGLALVAGIMLILSGFRHHNYSDGKWHTTYSYQHDDDDDYDYDYKYRSWSDFLLQVPLLGSSHKSKAQRHADEAKDYLYLDPKHEEERRHHHKKHIASSKHLLLGSPGENEKHDKDLKAPEGCEGTVLIIRHCEKGSVREHCNYVGYERSVYLASLFGDHATERYPPPSYLIAESPGDRRNPKKKNFREVETLMPLAEKFNLKVDASFSTLDMHSFTKYVHGLFRTGDMCGKVMVIAWKHSKIPRVATALGCGPKEGCPMDYPRDEFDPIVQVKFVYHKAFHSERKSLKPPKERKWYIFGSVHDQGFDPLAFSKQIGDYPLGGTSHGARWRAFDYEIPERSLDEKHHKHKKKLKALFWKP